MRYKCYFCDYETDVRAQIHVHHITPRALGGVNKQFNTINLCPNHHNQIYVPEADKGIHAQKGVKSIQIIGWRLSSAGRLLEYADENGNICYK